MRKGLVLAGGSGTRLHPITQATVKQLLPIYDKPLIYYPLSVLMTAGVRDVLMITTPRDQAVFIELFGDGARFGLNLSYAVQPSPEGLAQAFLIGREFIGRDPSCLILGDNIFHGGGLGARLRTVAERREGATVFTYRVSDPERYGVVEFGASGEPLRLHEKPKTYISNFAVTGLYFYDTDVCDIAASVRPSKRGELEITDVNQIYLDRGKLTCENLGNGVAWLDAGTPDSILEASQYVRAIEKRQGHRIACLEAIALELGYITPDDVVRSARAIAKSEYGQYLLKLAEGRTTR
ncbi:glucose-1-phosphate thymidylyltransferase RfbA [bacterium]|nr:glucose-1-phosphate thymidylyltransferase RfbA [bacterium]